MGFWDSFQVYNKDKHSDPRMFGGNHSNIGEQKTTYLYSHEYYEPRTHKKMVENQELVMDGDKLVNARKSSVSSDSSEASGIGGDKIMGSENANTNLVDISQLSPNEFKRLYDSMRKGEPDNRVNR
ncbi:hypothetical protein HG535_0D03040 [Zygotorulaspora mrakii]|uniref:Stationary phase protein 4 n=1 Tax=Zygotorulaspora mrakii TaxID=42260 RepID=A0A7H9B2E0_ZYGMR|nr:uncharacterized protein HG535_0D03040 [Zygotorulaspora mrakii]QLG72596.1 hypothetical protein HG535_0D03040 [Zygotorulaspora mrakii]